MKPKELVLAHRNDLKDGEMKSYPIGQDRKILLSKIGGQFYAIGGICTHYGADLADGVLSGERVVCPWHHAVFNARTGDIEEPPALDALPTYPVSVRGDDVIVALPEEFQESRVPEMADYDPQRDDRTFVIVGAGAAGNAAAQTLRQDGFHGRIVMVTREDRTPYDRPQLSKEYLQGAADEEFIPLRSEEFYQQHGIELMFETEVKAIDVSKRAVLLEGGQTLNYDKLLLATGAIPRTLDLPGANLNNIYTLRTYDDSAAIIAASKNASAVAVIGASFIGMETAFSLRERNLPITVIAPEAVPFQAVLGREIGKLFQDLHEENGVQFSLNAKVARFEGTENVEAVVLEDGRRIVADLVVVGVGVRPAVDYLADSGLVSEGAVTVDEYFHAGGDVYAAGDIARFPSGDPGGQTRIEHWRTAEQQGRNAAHNMAGKRVPYESVPFFWTNQVDLYFRYVGHGEHWDEIIIQGDVASKDFLALYVKDGRVQAAAGNNREKEMGAIEELMRLNKMPRADDLRGGSIDLLALLGT